MVCILLPKGPNAACMIAKVTIGTKQKYILHVLNPETMHCAEILKRIYLSLLTWMPRFKSWYTNISLTLEGKYNVLSHWIRYVIRFGLNDSLYGKVHGRVSM